MSTVDILKEVIMLNINLPPTSLFMLCIAGMLMLVAILMSSRHKKLDSIKALEVGDGQHGNARWMSEKEKNQLYEKIKLPKKAVDMSGSWKPGRVIGYEPNSREMLIDTSDSHANIMAPSGTGKTTKYLVPNIQYNLMAGTSMIVPDLKGENKKLTEGMAKKLGYQIYTFDFINLIDSCTIDLFEDINEAMYKYMSTGDIIAKATAESLAGELANEITSSKERGSGDNSFFLGASKGLLQSTILLVSMFGNKNEKHLSSVRSTLQNIASMPKDPNNPTPAIIKLMADMPDDFGPKKQMGAAFAASSETEDNIYSSALDDLRPFNDALAEQIICVPQKQGKFSYKDLLNHKSIVYIVLPDEKSEFKIIGRILMKKIIQQLGNAAAQYPEKRLPKTIKVMWEEFAEYDKIPNVGSWLQVKRGQGVLFDLIYQDEAGLKEKYGNNIPTVLKNNCGTSIILGVAPEDEKYAESLSKILGTSTIQSGSVSVNYQPGQLLQNSRSVTNQMIGRPLMSVDEILHMESNGIQIVLKRGQFPMKTHLYPYYSKEWGLAIEKAEQISQTSNSFYQIEYISFEELKKKLRDYAGMYKTARNKKKKRTEDAITEFSRKIYEETNDEKAVELIIRKDWNGFLEHMNKNHKNIAKIQLIREIQKLKE